MLRMSAVKKLYTLPRLTKLEISNFKFSKTASISFCQACFTSLTELQLERCKLRIRQLESLLSAAWLRRLTTLDVSNNSLDDSHFQLLGQAPLDALTSLTVDSNLLHRHSVEVLAQGEWWPMLQSLSVRSGHLKPDGMEVLCATTGPMMDTLDVSGNYIGVGGMTAFSEGTWPQLRCVRMNSCGLDGEISALVMHDLLSQANAPMLEVVAFNSNTVNSLAIEALPHFQFALRELHFSNVGLTAPLLWDLQTALEMSIVTESLELLDVSGNARDTGIAIYAELFYSIGWNEHVALMEEIDAFFWTDWGYIKFHRLPGDVPEKFTQECFDSLFAPYGHHTRVKLLH